MKPLPRENTIWEFLRARIFMIFDTCFTVSSRIHILSTFYRILSVLGLHFGTLGTTFWGLFFRSRKMPEVLLVSAPGSRPSSTPPGEGGNWETSGRHLGGIWEASGRHLGGIWEASGRHLGDIWEASGRHLEGIWEASGRHLEGIWGASETPGRHLGGLGDIWKASGRIWEASGRHLGSIWEASRRHLGGKGPEEAQRRLGLKKLIDVCSQMQKFLLFFNFAMHF